MYVEKNQCSRSPAQEAILRAPSEAPLRGTSGSEDGGESLGREGVGVGVRVGVGVGVGVGSWPLDHWFSISLCLPQGCEIHHVRHAQASAVVLPPSHFPPPGLKPGSLGQGPGPSQLDYSGSVTHRPAFCAAD